MAECNKCLHNPVCSLWRDAECQDACSQLTGGLDECPLYKPQADVVEVVRCKDCVRWSPDGGYGLDLDGTKRLYGECVITNFSHKENHFCSYGVSKMDGKGEGE